MPFDLGAHWIHNPDSNPLSKLAPKAGLDIYPAPRGQTVRVGPRNARDSELENFLAALVRSHRAIADAGRAKTDVAAAALPRDLGDWQGTIEFILGPYGCGKDLKAVSAMDLARVAERDSDAFCRQGYGALLARLAADLPVRLATPVRRIEWDRNGVDVETPKGMLRARTVIVTVSTNVLASDKIEFKPELREAPARCRGQALARQFRSHRARHAGQSARPATRRPGVRAIDRCAHRRTARQCVGHESASGRGRRRISAASWPPKARPR